MSYDVHITKNTSKVLFIINPASGNGKNKAISSIIENTIDRAKFNYEIKYTTKQGDASKFSSEACLNEYDMVIAVGGDGTVHEVGIPLIGSNTALGIIPTGSGNGLARHCKIPCNSKKAMDVINRMQIQRIDTIKINEDHFLHMACIGFDAHIAKKFSEYGKRGFLSYLKVSIKEFFAYKSQKYHLVIDGIASTHQAFLISFANSAQYGNNILISPQAKIDDGLLDVAVLRPFPFMSIPFLALQLFTGNINKSKYLKIIPCKTIEIVGGPFKAHLDGEPVTFEKNIQMSVFPASLRLCSNSKI
jgi:diacylglycerol kinase (ATP)